MERSDMWQNARRASRVKALWRKITSLKVSKSQKQKILWRKITFLKSLLAIFFRFLSHIFWWIYFNFGVSIWSDWPMNLSQNFKSEKEVQQGFKIHGLESCGPWRYMVFNWFQITWDTRFLAKSLEDARFLIFW